MKWMPLNIALLFFPLFSAPSSAQPALTKVDVTLRITGISHLVGEEGASERTLVVTNHHGLFGGGHHLLLLVDQDLFPDTRHLNQSESRTFNGKTTNYKYREFPDGYEIDLIASGWYNASPSLAFKEDGDQDKPNAGDQNVECPEDGDPASLHWLPRLSTASGKIPLKVKTGFVAPNPSRRDVLTRIEMKDGTLKASVRAKAAKYEFVVQGPNNNHKQAVADYLDYTFPAYMKSTDTYFVLIGRKFNSNPDAPPEYQELARVKPAGNQVVLTLANVMEHDFFHPMVTNTLPHFKDYYGIIDSPPVKGEPRFEKYCDSSGGDSGVECGPDRAP